MTNCNFDAFDAVFVLNLEKRNDRMERVNDVLYYLQIPFERFNAIDSEVVTGLHNNLISKNVTSTMTRPGYLACLLSHLSIYKTALDRGFEKVLILEDDILVHKNAKESIKTFMPQVPNNWDMIYFGYLPLSEDLQYWSYLNFEPLQANGDERNPIEPSKNESNVFCAKGLWCTHAYAITSKFMKDIIEMYGNTAFEQWLEIDRFLVQQQKQKKNAIYGCNPPLFGQNEEKFINSSLTRREDFL